VADYGVGSNYPVQADIPARQPDLPAGQRMPRQTGGLATAALAALGFILKFKGLAATFISTAIAVWVYAQIFGLWVFALGFVVLILIHESGHLIVARMIGLPASLPIMIPGLGAFVSMKQQPKSAAQEAQMAIGGPILGTVAAGICYLGYLPAPDTYWGRLLLGLAYFGFFINLFNLLPVTPLDGGRVLSVVSKWFNVAGLVIAAGLLLLTPFHSPLLLLILIFGGFSTFQRFRSTAENPAYYDVPANTKWTIGLVYLSLLVGLALGAAHTVHLLPQGV